ncbi:MAG: hypothetical protein DWQ34_01270 [Planctomycetota bacterium]|nr:MAG: hypothetical protein DWQ29_06560 [Planctomycetota bacterium]REJ97707.1 MAG: hypothetical protein DWQ34_01270 [Planctomycetota bacterium]REK26679.1 MAG: hypothetical protein DWQ41_09010 [Planctomycetota bacterium]REK35662.1 MAG: hypothetical protein DWQ45_10945 [Planctomycetota bacterium]
MSAVEQAVADLRQRLDAMREAPSWLDRMTGAFAEFPEFEDVIRYGRQTRESERSDNGDEENW